MSDREQMLLEYEKKKQQAIDKFNKEVDYWESLAPDWRGKDHPYGAEIRKAEKEILNTFIELKKQYKDYID